MSSLADPIFKPNGCAVVDSTLASIGRKLAELRQHDDDLLVRLARERRADAEDSIARIFKALRADHPEPESAVARVGRLLAERDQRETANLFRHVRNIYSAR